MKEENVMKKIRSWKSLEQIEKNKMFMKET